jgi:succinate dehydrogenase / fumarate reductase cytochrome b subunit
LLFLIIHVIDTFFVVFNPALYDHTVAIYGGVIGGEYYWPLRWAFRLAELGLIATVLFHAVNGVRVILFDFWNDGCKYQKESFRAVMLVFLALMIPAAIAVILPLASAPEHTVKIPENVVTARP